MLPIFNLEIEGMEDGIYAVSIVKHPATEQAYMLFNKDSEMQKFRIEDEEKQIVTGVLMTANSLIYRSNEEIGEHYIRFTPEAIRKGMQLFFRDGHHLTANFEHNSNQPVNGVYFYESFQVDQERGISAPKGMDVPDGSWVGTMKVEDPAIWELIRQGDFTGFSIEGFFTYTTPEEDASDDELMEAIESLLDELEKKK